MNELIDIVQKITKDMPLVTQRAAYGTDVFFAKENIFIAVTKEQRIALKAYSDDTRKKLLSISGPAEWHLDGNLMENWILLPSTFNKKRNKLTPWLEISYRDAISPPKGKKGKHNKKKKNKESNHMLAEQAQPQNQNNKAPPQTEGASILKRLLIFFR